MIGLLQRVRHARVQVAGNTVGEIGRGLLNWRFILPMVLWVFGAMALAGLGLSKLLAIGLPPLVAVVGGASSGKSTVYNPLLGCQLIDNSGNAPFYHQIRWEQDGAQVIQTWETLDENQHIPTLLFKGFYKTNSPQP